MMLNDPHPRIVISDDCEKSLSFEAQGLTLSLHVPRTSPLSSAVFHTASTLSAPSGHLPLEWKAVDTRETCHPQTFGHRHVSSS